MAFMSIKGNILSNLSDLALTMIFRKMGNVALMKNRRIVDVTILRKLFSRQNFLVRD